MKLYLNVEAAAAMLHLSPRQLREHARRCQVPHRRLPGMRRVLFDESEIRAFLDGAPLEVVETPGGGRVVRPMEPNGSRTK
jgi:hypothetical protein